MINMRPHFLLTKKPLPSGDKFISEPIPLDGYTSMRGWAYSDEDGKLAVFQSFGNKGEYRKISRDIPVLGRELTLYNVPIFGRFGLIIFCQGMIQSTELELILTLSHGDGDLAGFYNVPGENI